MLTITEIKDIIKNSIVGGNQWHFKPNLTETQLLELREAVKEGDKLKGKTNDEEFENLIKIRAYGCWIGGIDRELKKMIKQPIKKSYGFRFDNLNIQAEKPNEIIAYKEPTFTPRETEADYNISQSVDNTEDSWEIEEYTRKERERERENMASDDYENVASSSQQLRTINIYDVIKKNKEKDLEIERLRTELEQLKLEKEQTAQIEQPPKWKEN